MKRRTFITTAAMAGTAGCIGKLSIPSRPTTDGFTVEVRGVDTDKITTEIQNNGDYWNVYVRLHISEGEQWPDALVIHDGKREEYPLDPGKEQLEFTTLPEPSSKRLQIFVDGVLLDEFEIVVREN